MVKIKRLIAALCALALMVPGSAFAQGASDEGYGGAGDIAGQIDSGGDDGGDAVPVDDGGSLPFTGADLGVLLAAGGLLVGLGFGLRRLTHRPSEA